MTLPASAPIVPELCPFAPQGRIPGIMNARIGIVNSQIGIVSTERQRRRSLRPHGAGRVRRHDRQWGPGPCRAPRSPALLPIGSLHGRRHGSLNLCRPMSYGKRKNTIGFR